MLLFLYGTINRTHMVGPAYFLTMQASSIKIDLHIELSSEGTFQIISSSVDCQEKESASISELINDAIAASDVAKN